MPGTAACAEGASSKAAVATATERKRETAHQCFEFKWLMVALLRRYYNFSHQPAEVLGVVRQMVKLWCVEEVHTGGNPGAVENHIQRLAAAQSDRVGCDVEVIACLVAQQLGVEANQLHGNAYGRQCLVFLNVQVGNA